MFGSPFAVFLVAAVTAGEAPASAARSVESLESIAGAYRYGDALRDSHLVVSPSGRFTFLKKPMPHELPGDRNQGGARIERGRLILTPELPTDGQEAVGFRTEFVPVRWGARYLLVPADRGREFCNAVNLNPDFDGIRFGTTFVGEEDRPGEAADRPVVPPEWEAMLLKAPIEGRLVEVLSDRRARVDFGSDRGAMTGLLVLIGTEYGCGIFGNECRGATLVEVGPTASVIELKAPPDDANRLKVGQHIFTKFPWPKFVEEQRRKSSDATKPRRSPTP